MSGLVELSINSVVGLTTPRTMKLTRKILGHQVLVMIDCGATHNFISAELAGKLALPITHTASYGVLMGTGLSVRGGGICKGVTVSLPSIDIIDDFLPLQLGCTDVILGMKWLGSLAKMQVNWEYIDHEV
ncbi:uncharacterized protein LOC111384242 [Olea europaea var. sylvestris]|uniref:uncharacterized protein LOC111384242 n=1 Tax=Olea europaea var. sylvestris TaxID=158386 RepID=UPI000C1CD3BA|nr:uncharacterized protein LOC111384242 [Olea europaea var. sylvestris]